MQSEHQSYDHWLFIWRHGAIGMALVDLEMRILDVNRAFAAGLGYGIQELRGRHVSEISHPAESMSGVKELELVAAGEIPFAEIDKTYINKRGGSVVAHLRSGPIRNDAGEITHYVSQIIFRKNGTEHIARVSVLEAQVESLTRITEAVLGKTTETNIISGDQTQVTGNENHTGNTTSGQTKVIASMIVAIVGLVGYLAYLATWPNHDGNAEPPPSPGRQHEVQNSPPALERSPETTND